MIGAELIEKLNALIEKHGNLPVFNEEGEPLHDFQEQS
jgi:hypothetical protein